MTDQAQITADQYRFAGYKLDLIILDETGPSYAVAKPHPYYYNQPTYWQVPAYKGDTFYLAETIEGEIHMEQSGVTAGSVSSLNDDAHNELQFQMISF